MKLSVVLLRHTIQAKPADALVPSGIVGDVLIVAY